MQQRFIFYFTVTFLMLSAVLMATAFCEGTEPTLYSPPVTRLYLSESNVELSAMPEAIPDTHLETYDPDADQNAILESVPLIPAEVSVFYPTTGQPGYGICWMGLKIDSNDNVYPINGTGFYKILPDGWLVNGVNDENLFASGTNSRWGELDEIGGKLYTVRTNYVRSAAFLEGSEFSNLISFSGISFNKGIVLGQGPLSGSLFFPVDSEPSGVFRLTLDSLEISVFANVSFYEPGAIASAPDGTLYVADFSPPRLIKITPEGVPSNFAIGTDNQVNGAVSVDSSGNVYWSHANGINKYDASGNLLGTLPGPPDKGAYGNPMGSDFDSEWNLYIIDNFDCKKIYKYTFLDQNTPPVAICQDVTVSTEAGLCTANASIDDGSFDPDGDEITLEQAPPGPYDLGDTDVTLTVTDDKDASDTCDATVTVVDEEAPVISSVSANPNKLWPPNHKMVPVTVAVDATDNCDSVCQIISVTSNEPVNGLGDGNTAPDWVITGDLTVKLRAERSGKGNGRIYTITVECADSSGNNSTDTAKVTVPHDKGKKNNQKNKKKK